MSMLDATRTIPSMIRCQACLVTGLMQTSVTTEIERMSMPKHRSRRGEPLPRDAALVLRGDDLDPDLLSETAQENSVVYGFFGTRCSSRSVASAGRRLLRTVSSEPGGLPSSLLATSSELALSCGTPVEIRLRCCAREVLGVGHPVHRLPAPPRGESALPAARGGA